MRALIALLLVCCAAPATSAAVLKVPHVEVTYEGIDERQARAIAEVVAAAREAYITHFAFEMPEVIRCSVTCGPGQTSRLFTDGNDSLFLSMPSQASLTPPAKSGVFTLYGLCHELGHIAMYRVLKERDWMTGAAAEGWAHYAGSVVVDRVYEMTGEAVWPEKYDYRADGTARLKKQLSAAPSPTSKAAGEWQKLEAIVGTRGFPALFAAWNQLKSADAKQADALGAALSKVVAGKQKETETWWAAASALFVEQRQSSTFKATAVPAARLSGKVMTLESDDGSADGRKSIAGAAQGRKFTAPGGNWCITAVSVFGARYGAPRPPTTAFDVVLCDAEFRPIATWSRPHSAFARGEMKWVRLEVPPTLVPEAFHVCVNFKATATNGVFLGVDSSTKGSSVTGTPGKEPAAFDAGDWMIRVEIDRLREADALRGS